MARSIRAHNLETRSARLRLPVQGKPYTVRIAPGIRLAYRRTQTAGVWSVKAANGAGGDWLRKFAIADDYEEADGSTVMDYWQATKAARELARATNGVVDTERPMTVAEGIEAYRRDLATRGGNEWNATGLLPKLTPALSSKAVSLLTKKDVLAFRDALVAGDIKSATVNRYMTQFVAALNHTAELDDRITNTKAWKLDALANDSDARNVILPDDKVQTIVAAAYDQDSAFGLLVETLAQTGARISQALRLTVDDVLPGDRLNMPASRKGKGAKAVQRRPLPITVGLAGRLRRASAGRHPGAPLLLDCDGKAWTKGCQEKPFKAIVRAAGLDPAEVTTYALRHSSVVRQLLQNVPVRLVAVSHDTSVRMIERTYSKYILDVSDDLTRRALLTDPTPPHPPAANDNQPSGLACSICSISI